MNFLALLAAMSLAPSPGPVFNPIQVYSQSLPVSATVAGVVPAAPVKPPRKIDSSQKGVRVSGKAAFVADVESGGVMFADHPHDVYPMASLTKLMTALVVLESDKRLDGELTFLPEDFSAEGGSEFNSGDVMSRRDVFRAMLVGSVNEAAAALARDSGWTREEFIERMNQKARDLNLKSLSFTDPTGLEPTDKGNAADIAALLTTALGHTDIREVMKNSTVDITTKAGKKYTIKSTNLLLTTFINKPPYSIIGAKTGTLPEAGYCMAQVTRNAEGHEVVAVLLGGNNHFARYNDIKAMTYWAFNNFVWE